jgi:hypothetical protein
LAAFESCCRLRRARRLTLELFPASLSLDEEEEEAEESKALLMIFWIALLVLDNFFFLSFSEPHLRLSLPIADKAKVNLK